MKKKILCVLAGLATVILLAGTTISVITNQKMLDKINDLNSQVATMQKELTGVEKQLNPDKVQGDEYVSIDNQYQITDTKKISDAYKSGDESQLDEKEKETLKMAKEVIDKVTKEGMTKYEKELAIHDWMASNITFDSSSLSAIPGSSEFCYKPYGVLKYKKSVCVGFATTFKLFMNMLDMDCIVVHDTELTHSWDLVELEKDKWYYVDVTFDAGTTATHTNFNQTETAFKEGHSFYSEDLPKADDYTYNYAVMNAKTETDIKKIPKLIKKVYDSNGKQRELFINVGKKDENELQQISLLFSAIQDRISMSGDSFASLSNAVDSNGAAIFGITIDKYNSEEPIVDNALSDELLNIINDLFGEPNYDYEENYEDMSGVQPMG